MATTLQNLKMLAIRDQKKSTLPISISLLLCRRITPNSTVAEDLKLDVAAELQEWETVVSKKDHQQPVSKPEGNLEDYQEYFQKEEETKGKKLARAEQERIKGNQAIRSKDFDEAITYYTRSIDIDPQMHQSYGNRAMAYLKKKGTSFTIQNMKNVLLIVTELLLSTKIMVKPGIGRERLLLV